jgi:hypothetical protein
MTADAQTVALRILAILCWSSPYDAVIEPVPLDRVNAPNRTAGGAPFQIRDSAAKLAAPLRRRAGGGSRRDDRDIRRRCSARSRSIAARSPNVTQRPGTLLANAMTPRAEPRA